MLALKFKRIGKKHQAAFRVVVMEKRSKLQGRFIGDLGWMNPGDGKFELCREKAEHWLRVGAKPTDSVHNLFVRAGLIKELKRTVHKKSKRKARNADEGQQAAESRKEGVQSPQAQS